jgi:hypothetical protein
VPLPVSIAAKLARICGMVLLRFYLTIKHTVKDKAT